MIPSLWFLSVYNSLLLFTCSFLLYYLLQILCYWFFHIFSFFCLFLLFHSHCAFISLFCSFFILCFLPLLVSFSCCSLLVISPPAVSSVTVFPFNLCPLVVFPSPVFFLSFYPFRYFRSLLAIFLSLFLAVFYLPVTPRFLLFSAPLFSFVSLLSLSLYPPLCVSLSPFLLFSVAPLSAPKINSLQLFFVLSLCPNWRHLTVYNSLPLFVCIFLFALSVSHSFS